MTRLLLLMAGGAVGTLCRYGLTVGVHAISRQHTFPWAHLLVNVSGSFLIGVLATLFQERWLVDPAIRIALLTGLLGGYTTFSSFSFETLALMRDGEYGLALLNAGGSVVLGLAAVWAGLRVARMF